MIIKIVLPPRGFKFESCGQIPARKGPNLQKYRNCTWTTDVFCAVHVYNVVIALFLANVHLNMY